MSIMSPAINSLPSARAISLITHFNVRFDLWDGNDVRDCRRATCNTNHDPPSRQPSNDVLHHLHFILSFFHSLFWDTTLHSPSIGQHPHPQHISTYQRATVKRWTLCSSSHRLSYLWIPHLRLSWNHHHIFTLSRRLPPHGFIFICSAAFKCPPAVLTRLVWGIPHTPEAKW